MKLLSEFGVIFGMGRSSKNSFLNYIQYRMQKLLKDQKSFFWIAMQGGWLRTKEDHHVYVTPTRTIGKAADTVIYDGDDEHAARFGHAETCQAWRDNVASLAAGNSRAVFATCVGFSGPLLFFCDGENTIYHLFCQSSGGKTTLMYLPASIWGQPRLQVLSYNSSTNAMLANAALHNDGLLCFDEIASCPPDAVYDMAYAIGNATGRSRATIGGGAKSVTKFRVSVLSTGERDLETYMRGDSRTNKTPHAGVENRFISLPCDTGSGKAVFETTGDLSGKEFAEKIKRATHQHYGTVGPEFVRLLSETDPDELRREITRLTAEFVRIVCPKGSHAQVQRAATRFALVCVAGTLATRWGLTGWDEGEAFRAAKICFAAWLDHRGGPGQQEISSLLAQVRLFFEQQGDSRFKIVRADEKLEDTKVIDMYGYRRNRVDSFVTGDVVATEYFVLPESFKRVVAGFEPKWAAKILLEKGCLKPGKDGYPSSNHSFGGLKGKRYYRFEFDEEHGSDA